MKIGFVAMSGIRICDPELFALGLTLPGVIERGNVIAALPSLGLLTLAGMTPLEHEIQYVEYQDESQIESISQFDIVAISSLAPQIFEAYDLSEQLRARGTQVVMGGLHVTAMPEEAKRHCDAVVVGEGESFWPELVADAAAGRLKPVYRDDRLSFDLSLAPMPRFDLLNTSQYNRITIQTARGCPLKCEFCAGSILLTDRYKQKPVECVLAEVDRVVELWKRPFIEFADDNSFCNRRYWEQLLPQLRERKVRWFTETDISIGQHDELLEQIQRAGCVEVLIGLESPDQDSLKGIELKSDWKRRHWTEYRESIRNIQRHGIAVNGCFICGLDNQRVDIFDRIFELSEELELFDVQVTIQTPFPGTPLYDRLLEEKRILEPGNWNKCTLFDVNFVPKHMTPEQLRSGFRHLVERLYNPEATHRRRAHFQRNYYIERS